jgi:hypothetical protein
VNVDSDVLVSSPVMLDRLLLLLLLRLEVDDVLEAAMEGTEVGSTDTVGMEVPDMLALSVTPSGMLTLMSVDDVDNDILLVDKDDVVGIKEELVVIKVVILGKGERVVTGRLIVVLGVAADAILVVEVGNIVDVDVGLDNVKVGLAETIGLVVMDMLTLAVVPSGILSGLLMLLLGSGAIVVVKLLIDVDIALLLKVGSTVSGGELDRLLLIGMVILVKRLVLVESITFVMEVLVMENIVLLLMSSILLELEVILMIVDVVSSVNSLASKCEVLLLELKAGIRVLSREPLVRLSLIPEGRLLVVGNEVSIVVLLVLNAVLLDVVAIRRDVVLSRSFVAELSNDDKIEVRSVLIVAETSELVGVVFCKAIVVSKEIVVVNCNEEVERLDKEL